MTEYFLSSGSHDTADDGRCAMEWTAHLAGEPHSDKPVCVSLMLTEFCIRLNDALPDGQRQRLRPYLARTIGTRGDGLDESRQWMCADWMIRTYLPTWLALVPSLKHRAETIRALSPVLAPENVTRAMVDLSRARSEAKASGAAVRDAAWAAAWDAVGDAAWAAVGAASGAAAWAAVRAAARDAAWAAVRDAAWAAVGDAAWAAVRDAVGDAAWAAARAAAWDAVRDAARAALAPSVLTLQNSVLSPGGLLDRMLPTEVIQIPVVSEWREICELSA